MQNKNKIVCMKTKLFYLCQTKTNYQPYQLIMAQITRKEYNDALDIVEAYHKQLFDIAKISPIPPKKKHKDSTLLETGDFVECVSLYDHVTTLTIGKNYEVVNVVHGKFSIINDIGVKRSYFFDNSMFKAIQ